MTRGPLPPFSSVCASCGWTGPEKWNIGRPVSGKVLFPIILSLFLCGICFAAKGSDLLDSERIGSLRIGLSESDVKLSTSCALQRGPEKLWGADGAYHQTLRCDACGLRLGMVSEKRGGPKHIESITLVAPGTLATSRGIRIGSAEQAVRKAYRAEWNREESKQSGNFVAGSIYGGLLFEFQDGKVIQIFLGAAAE